MPELRTTSRGASTLRTRIRYRFDNLLARGTWAVLLWLGVVTLIAVLVSSGLLALFAVDLAGSQDNTWIEDFWQSLLRILDSGTMAADVGWGRRVLALLVTVFGILVAGTLIGLIANGIEERVEAMRRGRSTVVESGHVVLLGASTRLAVVIEQLVLASLKRRPTAIVVLANDEPVGLQAEIRAAVDELHGSRVVFRNGDPSRVSDLAMVALKDARALIALADDDTAGDGGVVKAVLAAGAALGGFDRLPIVAELSDPQVAESLLRACDGAIHPVVASRSVGRITAFTLRAPGLSQVAEELLDFRGCEIYIHAVGGLVGTSFGECVFRFAAARPIGRIRADGAIELNPDPQTRLDERDLLVLIADDASVAPAPHGFADVPTSIKPPPHVLDIRPQEHLLLVGWNILGAHILASLDEFAAPGSSAEVVFDPRLLHAEDIRIPELTSVDVTVRPASGARWELSDEDTLSPATSIVLLAQRTGISADEADSRTLLSHMLLRRALDARGGSSPRIVVELLDEKNVELARVSGADDYVVSDAIASRIMAQLAEQPRRRAVLLQLYAADGPSVQLVPAADLGLSGDVGFDDIIATTYSFGLLAVGWRRGTDVVLNPATSQRVVLHDGDQVVAIG